MTSTQTQPAAPTRRQRRRLEIELRLLDASRSLFIEKGYDETTVAEIADAADVAYGTFFNYFPAKSDLLAAMGEREVAELSEQLSTLARRPGPIDMALTLLFDGFAKRLAAASPRERALAAKIQSITFAAAPADRDLGYQEAFATFIREAVTAKRARADVAVETLADLVASAYSAMALSWVHMPEFPVRDRARAMADLLGETLAPRGPYPTESSSTP
jgi:AcrR family transcriptional regulator